MLEVCSAGVHVAGSGWLFRDLSFNVQAGSLCAVLGPNGSGKTTLLKALMGTQKLTEGTIQRPLNLGHVPQSLAVLFDFSVQDMVLMGRANRIGLFGAPNKRDYAAAREALRKVGMSHCADRSFGTLSGGERQLVLLARALAGGADLVFLDEPTAALDLANEALVLSMLAELKALGTTLLMTTHDPDHAMQLADSVLLLGGNEHQFGRPSECLTDQALSRLYGVALQRVNIDTAEGPRSVLAKLHKRPITTEAHQ